MVKQRRVRRLPQEVCVDMDWFGDNADKVSGQIQHRLPVLGEDQAPASGLRVQSDDPYWEEGVHIRTGGSENAPRASAVSGRYKEHPPCAACHCPASQNLSFVPGGRG